MRAVKLGKLGKRCRTVAAPSPGPMLVLPPPGHSWNSASSLPPTSSSFKANNCTTDNVSAVMSPFQSYFRQNLIRRCGFPRCISPPPPPHPYSSCLRTKYFSPVVVLNLRTLLFPGTGGGGEGRNASIPQEASEEASVSRKQHRIQHKTSPSEAGVEVLGVGFREVLALGLGLRPQAIRVGAGAQLWYRRRRARPGRPQGFHGCS